MTCRARCGEGFSLFPLATEEHPQPLWDTLLLMIFPGGKSSHFTVAVASVWSEKLSLGAVAWVTNQRESSTTTSLNLSSEFQSVELVSLFNPTDL